MVSLVAAGCSGSDEVPTEAVAVVDGTDVTRAEFDALFGRAEVLYAPEAGLSEGRLRRVSVPPDSGGRPLVQRVEYDPQAESSA